MHRFVTIDEFLRNIAHIFATRQRRVLIVTGNDVRNIPMGLLTTERGVNIYIHTLDAYVHASEAHADAFDLVVVCVHGSEFEDSLDLAVLLAEYLAVYILTYDDNAHDESKHSALTDAITRRRVQGVIVAPTHDSEIALRRIFERVVAL